MIKTEARSLTDKLEIRQTECSFKWLLLSVEIQKSPRIITQTNRQDTDITSEIFLHILGPEVCNPGLYMITIHAN